jgi:hypothetical protein|tara:strand:+ start:18606 stop:19496 length:891 start_codon:yes stop_codon:yes gene_type:complete
MITFHRLGENGRLGNQLFQYAALRALSLENNYEIKIPNPTQRDWHGQSCLLENFNIGCDFLTASDLENLQFLYNEPDHMKYDENFFKIPDNSSINGFFQSTFYFGNFANQIKKELTPKEHITEQASERLSQIKSDYSGYEIVSLHLRRGDNTDWSNPNPKLSTMYGTNGELQNNSFYGRYLTAAKDNFKNRKVKFLVFTGGARSQNNENSNDIEWCQKNLEGEEYIIADKNTAMNDFSTIMNCDHNIISHISSFGWWAAYLNKNNNKEVIAPLHYHPDLENYTYREGFYPESWILK